MPYAPPNMPLVRVWAPTISDLDCGAGEAPGAADMVCGEGTVGPMDVLMPGIADCCVGDFG